MTDSAEIVVIGAGIVGCSVAAELARAGITDVVVLDQGPIEETGGSSSHAPGLVFHVNGTRAMLELALASSNAYRAIDDGDLRTWYELGGIELATTPERMLDLSRRRAYLASCGIDSTILTPAEIVALVPLIEPSRVLGGLLNPRDGLAKSLNICTALRREATAAGIEFHGLTEVTSVDRTGGRICAVETAAGRIETTTVFACPGIWSPALEQMLGVPLPLQPMQHLYARTAPIPSLAGNAGTEAEHPILRHQDRSMYFRQHGDAYGIGAYRHEPLAIDPPAFTREADGHTTAQSDFTPEHFTDARDATNTLMPSLNSIELVDSFNGHFSFSPDGYPLLGPSSHVRGLWLAAGIWVTHAGGAAKSVVELFLAGRSEIDLRQSNPDRFHAFATTRSYVRARGMQQYREVYDVIHPLQQIEEPRGIRTTPYHDRIVALGAVLHEGAGWERPQWYTSNDGLPAPDPAPARSSWASRYWSETIGREHRATRETVGIFELTPFVKLEVDGPGALRYLNHLCASQIDRPEGRVVYTTLLDDRGGVVCDLTVTRLAAERFLVITGGGSGPRDVSWLRRQLPDDGSVSLRDVTSSLCVLGVWGPRARDLLEGVTTDDVSNEAFPYMGARRLSIGAVPVLALRISYAGELGWELYAAAEHGRALWDALFEAGAPFGVVPCGVGAFGSLRLEKGYRFAGVDMHTEYTVDECGLGFTVDLEKGDFRGRDAVVAARAAGGPTKRLSCIVLDDLAATPYGYEPISIGGDVVGYVTSADTGYTVGSSIAYGYLPTELAAPGVRVSIDVMGVPVAGTVTAEPLFDPKGARLRA